MADFDIYEKELINFVSECLYTKGELLGLDYTDVVRKYIKRLEALNTLRITVMGEFKRGKSSVINALLGKDILPVATLPCTSDIIEIKHGNVEKYYEIDDFGNKKKRTEHQFKEIAGQARNKINKSGESVQHKVKRWELNIPSKFFDGNDKFIIVDTPGIKEDELRSAMIVEEAKSAHAVVLVLSADQLLSLEECSLIESIGRKVKGLLVVINRIDTIAKDEWNTLLMHTLSRLEEFKVKREQIVFFSAKGVIEGEKNRANNGKWLKLLDDVKKALDNIIFQNTREIRSANIRELCKNLKKDIISVINRKSNDLNKLIKKLNNKNNELETRKIKVKYRVNETFNRLLILSKEISTDFEILFISDWEKIVRSLQDKKTYWSSCENPILSAKAFAEDIAGQAKNSLIKLVEDWVQEKIKPSLEYKLKNCLDECKDNFNEISDHLKSIQCDGKTFDKDILLKNTFKNICSSLPESDIDDSVFGDTFLSGIISAIIGYVIADIILYYILGLISGFLNPFLLVGALVVAAFMFFLGTPDFVANNLRDKIADKIIDKLLDSDTRKTIRLEIKNKLEEKFKMFAYDFKKNTEALLSETETKFTKSLLYEIKQEQKTISNLNKDIDEIYSVLNELEERSGILCNA